MTGFISGTPTPPELKVDYPSRVWLHRDTGNLWECLPTSLGGYAIASIDIENTPFTSWIDWSDRGFFHFEDDEVYKHEFFIDLGEL